jgi:hypothetical protein
MLVSEKSRVCNGLFDHQFYERRILGFSFYQCKLCKKRVSNTNIINIQFLQDSSIRHVENKLLNEKFLILQMEQERKQNDQ